MSLIWDTPNSTKGKSGAAPTSSIGSPVREMARRFAVVDFLHRAICYLEKEFNPYDSRFIREANMDARYLLLDKAEECMPDTAHKAGL